MAVHTDGELFKYYVMTETQSNIISILDDQTLNLLCDTFEINMEADNSYNDLNRSPDETVDESDKDLDFLPNSPSLSNDNISESELDETAANIDKNITSVDNNVEL